MPEEKHFGRLRVTQEWVNISVAVLAVLLPGLVGGAFAYHQTQKNMAVHHARLVERVEAARQDIQDLRSEVRFIRQKVLAEGRQADRLIRVVKHRLPEGTPAQDRDGTHGILSGEVARPQR